MTAIATQIRARLDAIAAERVSLDDEESSENPLLNEVRRIATDPPWWWRDAYRDLSGRLFPFSVEKR